MKPTIEEVRESILRCASLGIDPPPTLTLEEAAVLIAALDVAEAADNWIAGRDGHGLIDRVQSFLTTICPAPSAGSTPK